MSRPSWIHAVQVNDGPFKAETSHAIKVVGSHCHLPLSNMKGVSSIPPPLNEALHQGSAHSLFRNKSNDRLEARLSNIGPSFRGKKVVPLHHLIGASPTNIRDDDYKKGRSY